MPDKFYPGDFVQLEPGNASAENWGIIVRFDGEEAVIAHYLDGTTQKVGPSRLFRPEAPNFRAAIRAFMAAMFNT